SSTYTLDIKSSTAANVIGKDTLTGKFAFDGKLVSLTFGGNTGAAGAAGGFRGGRRPRPSTHLSGRLNGVLFNGTGAVSPEELSAWTPPSPKPLRPTRRGQPAAVPSA